MSCSVGSAAITAKPALVSVNGVVVPRDAIAREVQQHPAPTPLAAWKEAARALAVRELLLQEAQRVRVSADARTDDAGRRETAEEAAIRALVEREVAVPEPDEVACRRYYEQNKRRFRSADLYESAHILVAARARNGRAHREARERADAILAEVKQQPSVFAELARTHSDCPSAVQGGNLGQITSGQTTPEFERALKALAPGSISDAPVATRYGFHIIRLGRKIEGHPLPFDAVATQIAEYLGESVRRRAVAQYIARLAARAAITGIDLPTPEAHRVSRPKPTGSIEAAMLLGDLLAQVERAEAAGNAAALFNDLAVLARVAEAAARRGMDPDDYVIAAVRRFEHAASAEDWVTLMGVASGHANPGSACLRRMVERALADDPSH